MWTSIKKFLFSARGLTILGVALVVGGAAATRAYFQVVPNMTVLAGYTAPTMSLLQSVDLVAYYDGGNDGGGQFQWYGAGDCPYSASDGGYVISPSDHAGSVASGCMVRLSPISDGLQVCWWGACEGATSTEDTTGIQAAVDFTVANTDWRNATIHLSDPDYTLTTTITKSESFYCPNIVGSGNSVTTVTYSPASLSPAFEFVGGSGQKCFGGLYDLAVTGNSNTIGLEVYNQDGLSWNFRMLTGYEAVRFCNCTTSAQDEEDVGAVIIDNTSDLSGPPLGETVVSGGGGNSFRGSGFGDGTLVNVDSSLSSALFVIGSGSYYYNGVFGGEYNADGSYGATLIDNQSSNTAVITSGDLDLEGVNTNVLTFANTSDHPLDFGGTVTDQAQRLCIGFDPSNVIYFKTWNILSGVEEMHGASAQCRVKTFTGAATSVTLDAATGAVTGANYFVQINNSDSTYLKSFQITQAKTYNSSVCSGAIVTSGGTDSHSYGNPAITCSGSQLVLTWSGGIGSDDKEVDYQWSN